MNNRPIPPRYLRWQSAERSLGPSYLEVRREGHGPVVLREVLTAADGSVIARRPDSYGDDAISVFLPDIEQALADGEMSLISRSEFEEAWSRPYRQEPSFTSRIRDWILRVLRGTRK